MFTLRLCESNDNFARIASLSRSRFQDCLHILLLSSIVLPLCFTKIPASLSFFPPYIHVYCGFCLLYPSPLFPLEKSIITIHKPAEVLPLPRRFPEPSLPHIKIRPLPFLFSYYFAYYLYWGIYCLFLSS